MLYFSLGQGQKLAHVARVTKTSYLEKVKNLKHGGKDA